MSVLIIGAPEEAHAAFIHQKVTERGEQALYFDSRRFPSGMRFSLDPENKGTGSLFLDGETLPLSEIRSAYWRYFMGIEVPQAITDSFQREMAMREIDSAIGSLFRMLDCRWVNSAEAIAMHAYKTYQLQLLARAGIRVPATLVSNDPHEVIAFYEAQNGQVIFKPVRGGAHTQTLSQDDLKPERLKELAKSPVQFQELVEGVDIRVYKVGKELFSAEIRSTTLDFRADAEAQIVPIDIPDTVAADCHQLADLLGLLFSGIDVRRTPEGEYVFLEGNPCPMFIHFERQSNYPISDRLVDLLLK